MKSLIAIAALLLVACACAAPPSSPTPAPTSTVEASMNLTEQEAATLGSLQLVDAYPLYSMRYVASYDVHAGAASRSIRVIPADRASSGNGPATWGCTLFAALGAQGNRLYGRNFDWEFSPALLLFTDPADGYASISMVDIKYLGFEGERSRGIHELPLENRRALLDAPLLPFDGMNETGLVVGMAAVDAQEMPYDAKRETLDSLGVIREMLDHAATVDEAIAILGSFNIDMGSVPLHYLVASAQGDSALVEFYRAEMVVLRNDTPWQAATNFLVASTNGAPQGQCPRYDRAARELTSREGRITSQEAFALLQQVSQENTQWSVVYDMTNPGAEIIMGRDYAGEIHSFDLKP